MYRILISSQTSLAVQKCSEALSLELLDPGLDAALRLVILIVLVKSQATK